MTRSSQFQLDPTTSDSLEHSSQFELDPTKSDLMERSSQFELQVTQWSIHPSFSLIQDGNTDCAIGGGMKNGDALQNSSTVGSETSQAETSP